MTCGCACEPAPPPGARLVGGGAACGGIDAGGDGGSVVGAPAGGTGPGPCCGGCGGSAAGGCATFSGCCSPAGSTPGGGVAGGVIGAGAAGGGAAGLGSSGVTVRFGRGVPSLPVGPPVLVHRWLSGRTSRSGPS